MAANRETMNRNHIGWAALIAAGCSPAGTLPGDPDARNEAPAAEPAPGSQSSASAVPPSTAGPTPPAPTGPAAGASTAPGEGDAAAPSPAPVGDADEANYDLSVTFDFPETAAGSGTCKPGRYAGVFSGIYFPGVAVWPSPIPVFGNIELVLNETQDGEFLSIGEGTLDGLALELFPFSATVSGKVDCDTAKLEDGYLSNGVYIVGVLPYTFEGPITADYDTLTSSFVNAQWDVGEPDYATHTYGGSGTWQATWTP